jgi:hypothetical protein
MFRVLAVFFWMFVGFALVLVYDFGYGGAINAAIGIGIVAVFVTVAAFWED